MIEANSSSLPTLGETVRANKVALLIAALICLILSTAYVTLASRWYTASISLLPMESKSMQGLAGQLGPLTGLASLAGINLGGGEKSEPLAVLNSRQFVAEFIDDNRLLPILFARKWNAAKGSWRVTGDDIPDTRDGVEYFEQNIRRVGEDKKSGLVILTIEWKDPTAAADWANSMVARVNQRLRDRAIADAETSIAYLKAELQTAPQVSLQQSISKLLESQMQNLMVARGNKEYAYRVVDKATVAKKPTKPKKLLIVFGAILAGEFLMLAFLLMAASAKVAPMSER